MPNISSLELIAQFQTALREGWGVHLRRVGRNLDAGTAERREP